jgi:hypothetical protein
MYIIENQCGDIIASEPTVSKAIKAVESYWEHSMVESAAQVKQRIKIGGWTIVHKRLASEFHCTIEQA